MRAAGINWCTHMATTRDILRRVISEIPRNAQKTNDPNYCLAVWRQVELSSSDSLKLSPKVYKWLWKLLKRPVSAKMQEDDKVKTLQYMLYLFGLDSAAVGMALVADGDVDRMKEFTDMLDDEDEDDDIPEEPDDAAEPKKGEDEDDD